MNIEKRFYNEKGKEMELCNLGQELWEDYRDEDFEESRYKKYIEHIKLCAECKKGLEIDEIIDLRDLTIDYKIYE